MNLPVQHATDDPMMVWIFECKAGYVAEGANSNALVCEPLLSGRGLEACSGVTAAVRGNEAELAAVLRREVRHRDLVTKSQLA